MTIRVLHGHETRPLYEQWVSLVTLHSLSTWVKHIPQQSPTPCLDPGGSLGQRCCLAPEIATVGDYGGGA